MEEGVRKHTDAVLDVFLQRIMEIDEFKIKIQIERSAAVAEYLAKWLEIALPPNALRAHFTITFSYDDGACGEFDGDLFRKEP